MKKSKFCSIFIICIFVLSSVCRADLLTIKEPTDLNIPPSVLKENNFQTIQKSDVIELKTIKAIYHPKHDRRMYLGLDNIDKLPTLNDPINVALSPITWDKSHVHSKTLGLIPLISPYHKVREGFLTLSKVRNNRNRQAIMFVFLMNKEKVDPNKPTVVKNNSRVRMHILGSSKIFKEQKIIENELPLDVSMAKYEDGYASDEWNLVLPNRKPKEVRVSLLWSF